MSGRRNNVDDIGELAELGESVALAAGTCIVEIMSSSSRRSIRDGARSKSSRTDLVTEADRKSEQLITEAILRSRPNDSIVGEEGTARRGESGITWVVDPLDGTTNFVYGFSSFAVSIAATRNSQSLFGVVHDPVHRETFTATLGRGAHLNGEPLVPRSDAVALADALVGTGFGYTKERRADQARLLPVVLSSVRDIRRAGAAALDLCYVADGRLDGFYEAGLKPWDRGGRAF